MVELRQRRYGTLENRVPKSGYRIATADGRAKIVSFAGAPGYGCKMDKSSVHVNLCAVRLNLGLAVRLAIALVCRWIGKV